MKPMNQTIPNPTAIPAPGLLRLTKSQVEGINAKYRLLWVVTTQHGCEGELTLVVKKGRLRFVEVRFNGDLELARGGQDLPAPEIRKLDAQISSLCAYTEQTNGEARLVMTLDRGRLVGTEKVLAEELCPAR